MAADRYANQSQTPTTGPLADAGAYAKTLAGGIPFGMERGLGGIDAYQDPYQNQVVAATQGDFAHQRDLAGTAADAEATRAGAFGGSRAAVLKAGLLGDVNRNEASTLADLRSTGFNQSAARLQADRDRALAAGQAGAQGLLGYGQYLDTRGANALGGIQSGLGYGGQTFNSKTQMPYSDWKDALGLLIQGGSLLAGKPKAA